MSDRGGEDLLTRLSPLTDTRPATFAPFPQIPIGSLRGGPARTRQGLSRNNGDQHLRIALVYDAVYPWSIAGGEFHVHELSQQLAARGHDVHVVGMRWWKRDAVQWQGDVVVHGLVPTTGLYANGAKRSVVPPLKFAVACARFFARERFDVVDCCAMPYLPALAIAPVLRARRIPMVVTWFEVWGNYWRSYARAGAGESGRRWNVATARVGRAHVAISPLTAERVRGLNRNARVHMVPSGVEVPKVERQPEAGRIGWFGRAIAHKNLPLLLDALALLRDLPWRLAAIARGPALDGWKRHAAKLGLADRVEWQDPLPERADLFRELTSMRGRRADLAARGPRQGRARDGAPWDPTGVRRASRGCDHRVSGPGEERIARSPYPGPVGDALRQVLCDPDLAGRLSKSGTLLARRFAWQHATDEVEAVYRSTGTSRWRFTN